MLPNSAKGILGRVFQATVAIMIHLFSDRPLAPPLMIATSCLRSLFFYAKAMNPLVTCCDKTISPDQSFMLRLREALEASWDMLTAYGAVAKVGNPAFGRCYPTTQVVQHYYRATEIIRGKVWTGERRTQAVGRQPELRVLLRASVPAAQGDVFANS